MAEQNPEGDGGDEFGLTSTIGPLPVWGWMGISLALVLIYTQWRKNKTASKTSTTATAPPTTATDQTPPFIIQNYTQTPAGVPGPAGPSGPAGPTGATGPAGGTTPGHNPFPNPIPVPVGPAQPVSMPTTKQPLAYRVKPGDTLAKIASAYHVNGGAQALYQFNIGSGPGSANRSAKDVATLKQRGPDLIYSNEVIYIPQ